MSVPAVGGDSPSPSIENWEDIPEEKQDELMLNFVMTTLPLWQAEVNRSLEM